MAKRLKVHGLDPDGNTDGKFVGLSGGKATWLDGTGGGAGLPEIDIVDFGAAVDGDSGGGGTDDTDAVQAAVTAAGGEGNARVISSRRGICNIAGPFQDTSDGNAQILWPSLDAPDDPQIVIEMSGAAPAPPSYSVIGTTPTPETHLLYKQIAPSGTNGHMFGGVGPTGTFDDFTFALIRLSNLAFRMPPNAAHSAVDLSHVTGADLDNVVFDAGSYYIGGLSQPSTSTSYALKLPANNDGAFTRMGAVTVIGFYNGILMGEHTVGEMVQAGGCRRAFIFPGAYHASKFQRLMAVHCQRGMVFTGAAVGGDPNEHYVDVDQFDVEHAASGWWASVYDIDDASNYGKGKVKYHVVKAGVGVSDADWNVNGAVGLNPSAVGTEPTPLAVKDEGSTLTAAAASLDFVGAGVTATNIGGAVTVTVPGGSSGGSELVMADGVTAPPIPIENEAQDDWLYAD